MKTEKIIIATIVPVVVAVVIIAVLLAHSGGGVGLGGRGAPPAAMFAVMAKDDGTHNGYILTISHEGGDDLAVKDLQVQASTSGSTMATYDFGTLMQTSGTFSVGMHATSTSIPYANVTGQVVTVYVIHKPSKEKMFSSSTVAVQGA